MLVPSPTRTNVLKFNVLASYSIFICVVLSLLESVCTECVCLSLLKSSDQQHEAWFLSAAFAPPAYTQVGLF